MRMLLPKRILIVTASLLSSLYTMVHAQVSINPNGTPPHASAILDLTSSSKGVLIPRMTTAERNLIASPATGLMIYNTTNNTYNFYSGTVWVELVSGTSNKIIDTDMDTHVDVETSPDSDYISMRVAGNERVSILNNRIELFFPGGSIALGEEAGQQDDGSANFNTTIGTSAGASLITGERNVNIGAGAGTSNTSGSDNTYLGYHAGILSLSSNNTFVGTFAGMDNTNGAGNTFIGKDAGKSNTTAANNFFGGFDAGRSNTTGASNVFLGNNAGRLNVTGAFNVCIGSDAGYKNSVSGNTFIGAASGSSNSTGTQNTFLGFGAGSANNTTSFNTMIGNSAGANNELGEKNTFLGVNTGQDNQGSFNTFLGAFAGETNQSGTENTFVGELAGHGNSTGSNNTFLGRRAGNLNTTASGNTFVGRNAGMNNVTGASNTFVGQNAGAANTASNNTFIGQESGNANSIGTNNSFLGQRAGFTNSTGTSNTFLGTSAGQLNSTGSNNTLVGKGAGDVNTASNNTFLGMDAGGANTTGAGNTFLGKNAGLVNTTATQNTFVGLDAGKANTTASSNTFVGNNAGPTNTTGFENTFIGFAAGAANVNGDGNVFLGVNSGGNNTTADKNTFVGAYSGTLNSTGTANAFFGEHAGFNNTTGSHNTFIGNQAGPATGTLTNATSIGDSAMVSASNSLVLGHNARVGIGTSNPHASAKTEINSTTQGFLMPRMTTAQRNAIVSPAPGLMVFDLDKAALYFFDGVTWMPISYTPEISLPPISRYPDDSQFNDFFGHSVAITGDYAIVGAPGYDDIGEGINAQGAAYIFKKTNGSWIQEATLIAADPDTLDFFGTSVDIFGDYAIAGSPGDDNNKGSAYIFLRTGSTWSQQAKITASNGVAGDQFGFSVSMTDTKAIVGAPFDNVGANNEMGSVDVFNRSGTTWTNVQTLTSLFPNIDHWFGHSVSLMQDYLAIGAPHDGNDNEGRVYVYVFGGGTWTIQYNATGNDPDDNYGYAVSIEADYLAIGIPQEAGSGNGKVELRKRSGSMWNDYGTITGLTPGGTFGESVAINEDFLIIGDPSANTTYVYSNNTIAYTRLREIKDPAPNSPNVTVGTSSAVNGFNVLTSSDRPPCGFCPAFPGKVYFLNLE